MHQRATEAYMKLIHAVPSPWTHFKRRGSILGRGPWSSSPCQDPAR